MGSGWAVPIGVQNPHPVVRVIVRGEPQWGPLDYRVQGTLLAVLRHGEATGHPGGAVWPVISDIDLGLGEVRT